MQFPMQLVLFTFYLQDWEGPYQLPRELAEAVRQKPITSNSINVKAIWALAGDRGFQQRWKSRTIFWLETWVSLAPNPPVQHLLTSLRHVESSANP